MGNAETILDRTNLITSDGDGQDNDDTTIYGIYKYESATTSGLSVILFGRRLRLALFQQ